MEGFSYLDDLDASMEKSFDKVKDEQEEVVQTNENGNGFGDVYSPAESEAYDSYEPQKLNARHREMIRLHALGYKGVQIASILGVTPQNVYDTLNTPLAQAFLQEIEQARNGSVQDVRERLQEISPLAVEVVLDVMQNGSESNRLKAADKVLDKTGQKPGETVNHNHVHLTKEDINDIKKEHSGGPRVESENSSKEFNETNHELPQADEAEYEELESENNQAENAKHISENRTDDSRQN